MAGQGSKDDPREPSPSLTAPAIHPEFGSALDDLVAVARDGQRPDSPFFNPSDEWLVSQTRVFDDLPPHEQAQIIAEAFAKLGGSEH